MRFIEAEKPVIGICNGFQILVKGGFLGGTKPISSETLQQSVTLTYNSNYRFRDDWVRLVKPEGIDKKKCIWTIGIDDIDLPMAHGEGRYEGSPEHTQTLFDQSQIVFQYADSNGKPTMNFPETLMGHTGLLLESVVTKE